MQIAVVGAGVIGAGWAARFILHGHNVNMFDLQASAYAQVRTILAQAQAAHESLYDAVPAAGKQRHKPPGQWLIKPGLDT